MNDTLITIIPVICTVITLYILIRTTLKNNQKDDNESIKANTEINVKLGLLLTSNEGIKTDIKNLDKKFNDVNERLIRVEESTKLAHKRIDDMTKEG